MKNNYKTFNLNFLTSVTIKYMSESFEFSYDEGFKGNFFVKPRKSGWCSRYSFFDSNLSSIDELPHPYVDINKECYLKPRVILKFVCGSTHEIYYETDREAEHEYLIFQSNISNPLKFTQDGK